MKGSSPASILAKRSAQLTILLPGYSAKYLVAASSTAVPDEQPAIVKTIATTIKVTNNFFIFSPFVYDASCCDGGVLSDGGSGFSTASYSSHAPS